VEAKLAGVTEYIVKPFTMATLKAKLTNTLGRILELNRLSSGPLGSR
jgi:DNA-binding response OmpR family regulator